MTTEMKVHVVTLQVYVFKYVFKQVCLILLSIYAANGIGLISLGLQKCLGNKVSTGEDTDSRLPESENVVEEK